jgi:extracellular sulfatase Sulf
VYQLPIHFYREKYEHETFAKYLHDASYRTGYFGKYLNKYNGSYIPPGYHTWMGLIKNSKFYNYSINYNGVKINHGNDYYNDYLTDLVANESIKFIQQQREMFMKYVCVCITQACFISVIHSFS